MGSFEGPLTPDPTGVERQQVRGQPAGCTDDDQPDEEGRLAGADGAADGQGGFARLEHGQHQEGGAAHDRQQRQGKVPDEGPGRQCAAQDDVDSLRPG